MRTFTRWCSNMRHWRTSVKTVFTLLLLTLFISRSDAQNINVTFQQGSNENNTLGEIKWINSILQDNNSRIAEGMSTLQRVIITKLTPSTAQQTLIFKLQADKGGFHAYDFITSWEQALDATADIAPGKGLYPPTTSDPDMHNCADLATGGQPPSETQTCNSLRDGIYKTQVYIPTAGSAGSETNNPLLGDVESTVDVIAAYETTYGPRWLDFYADAAISGTSLRFLKYEAGYVFYEFKWTTNNASSLMIEFAAHVSLGISTAGQLGYGAGRGASQISGGPYHVILESTTLGGMGAMDNQLQGSDIVLQPTCNLTGDQLVCVSDGNQIYNGNPASLDNPVYSWAFTDDNIATANDNTSGASFVGATDGPSVTVNPGTGGLFRLRFIVTNDGDLADTCYLTVNVNSAPTITCPTNQTENACQTQSAINTKFATWLASVVSSGGTPTTNPVTPVAPSACGGSVTVTWTVTNDCGTQTCSASFTVTADNTPPAFTGSYADVNLTCNPASSAITGALGSATATDNCGTPSISHVDGTVQSSSCNRWQIRTFTATDACGNTATVSRRVNWIADVAPPVFTGSYADVNLNCNPVESAITAALDGATATDGCGTPTVSQSDGTTQSSGCNRWRIRTFTATDGCGNTATVSRRVNWVADVAPPVFTGSYADVNLNCNPAESAITGALNGATATDACGTPTVTQSDGTTQSSGCNRWRIRTFTATDGCGNTATVARRVNWIADVAPPVFTGSYADVNLNCNPVESAITAALDGATATDGCGTPTVSQSDGTTQSSGCNRWRIRTFTATDGCGNTATVSRRVNWIADVAPPVFTGSYADVNLNCNPAESAITGALNGATATDACGTPTVSQSDGTTQSSGCNRWRIRTFTATDGCGNTATVSRRVNWIADVAPPVFTGSYADVNLNCNPAESAITAALDGATATDGCGTPTVSQSDGTTQSSGCNRWRIRTFTATDGCGNTATVARRVNWIADVAPPVFTGSYADVNLNCNPAASAITAALGSATATDNCGTPSISQSTGTVQSSSCNRWQIRTFTATDGCGNTATVSRRVNWIVDVAPPALVGVPSNVDLDCGAEIPAPANVTATDNCGSVTPNYSFTDVAADCTSGFSRVVTRRWTVEDGCGNTASAQQVIRVRCCIDLLCTYTQGYFGNPGGLSCDGVNDDITTADLINGALGGGGLVVGRVPKTVTIPSGYGAYLINVLPGGGQPTLLSLDNVVLSNSSPYLPLSYLKNGKINNVLLSQTITLSLNARLNGGVLANFPIESGYLVTQKSSGCGEDATAVSCDFEDNMDAIQSFWMNQAVVDYLTTHSTPNVQGLLNLANDLLGGVLVPGGINNVPSYSNVVSALDAINRGFDECRFTLGYSADPVGCPEPPVITTSRPDPGVSNLTEVSKLSVAVYPNPYTDKVNFVIASPVSGQAQLEVYNMVGQRVASVYNGYIQAHVPHMVGYNVSTEAQQNLIYILRIGGQQVTGKLLNAKR